ncbi:MAG: signal peptidase I [Cycloclasticus sp.]|jgi:signal peptidase I|nr:signal peptidase I [Cycloclasticus sp.]MDF1690003.1 signal peptidase I [Cycloclasticus sp.]MEE4290224.1 signal peptidase I [Cycloclasticus sp.]
MHFDFSAALTLATFLTGIISAVYWLMQRSKNNLFSAKEPILVEYSKSFFPVLLFVLVLRSFIVEPFRIPSSSMMPTLLIGDFILVNKFSYGVRLPVVNTKIIDIGKPERGDIMVFRYPKNPSLDYIKRVIALPGDKVGYFDKHVYINGQRISQEPLGLYQGVGQGDNMTNSLLQRELLPLQEHDILIMSERPSIEGETIIPEGHYFMMGDNRDNSNDSRYWGTVPEENIVGKAFMIWMNWDSSNQGVDWKRLGSTIH